MAEKKVLMTIKEIEAEIEASHRGLQQRNEELLRDYLRAREPLLQRRYELVTGQSEPTEEELKGFKPQGAAAVAAVPDAKGAGGAAGGVAKAGGKAVKSGGARGVPFFWLNALCNQEKLADLITPRDRCALEYLEDVRYVVGPMGLALEFHFAPNPYFHNKVLRKGTFIRRAAAKAGQDEVGEGRGDGGGVGAGLGDLLRNLESWRDEHTVIDWKQGRSLLVRTEQPAAAGAGKKGGKQAEKRQQPQQQHEAGGSSSGGGKKKGKGKKGGAASAAVPSRSKRHGKHSGPAPDLPDPDEEEEEEVEEEEGVEVEEEGEQEEPAAGANTTTRRRPCPSFFRFFLPLTGGKLHRRREIDPTVEGGDSDEEQEEDGGEQEQEEEQEEGAGGEAAARVQQRRAQDAEILDVIVKRVLPRATTLYLAGHTAGGAGAGGPKARSRSVGGNSAGGDDADGDGDVEEEEGFQLVSGSPAGDVASLALGAQRSLHALVAQQRQLDELAAELRRGEWEAWVQHVEEVARLAARRRTLLVGPAAAASKLSVPAFWLRALRAAPFASLLVQHRDERAMSYLADVRLVWDTSRMPTPEDPQRRLDLELEFLPNPYFTNSVLVKRFTFHAPGGSLNRMWITAVQSHPIDWQPGRDLTVLAPVPEAKEGGAGGRAARPRKVPSFFALFDDSTGALCRAFGIPGGQSAAALQEANEAQEEFLAELINVLVNRAASFAAESNLDVDDLGDEHEEEPEEEDDDEEDEESEGADEASGEGAAARRAARRAAAKAARRRGGAGGAAGGGAADGVSGAGMGLLKRLFGGAGGGTGGVVMGVFVVIMLLAQVLVFLDTLEFVRARFK